MKVRVIALALLAAALGASGGFAGGYIVTVINRVHTDMQLACALLQTAESAAYIDKEQRSRLVDMVVPPVSKDGELRPESRPEVDWSRSFADGWWDSIREDQKSGCRSG